MTQDSDKLKNYLIKNVGTLRRIGGSGGSPEFPAFALCARDYLTYAEEDLNQYLTDRDEQ